MSNLISDLLDMAKSENKVKETYNNEDLSKLVERSILTFESLIYEKDIKLNYNIEENIKFSCNGSYILFGIEGLIISILLIYLIMSKVSKKTIKETFIILEKMEEI